MKARRIPTPGRALALTVLWLSLLFLQGCATSEWSITEKLWNDDVLSTRRAPAVKPHVQLFADETRSDVLVVYDELQAKHDRTIRRAFYVNQNLDRIRDGQMPRFTGLQAATGLKAIPILPAGSIERVPCEGLAVLETERLQEYRLFLDGNEVGQVWLPAYGRNYGLLKSALTPLTVTGDAVIVASGVAFGVAIAYAMSGPSFSSP